MVREKKVVLTFIVRIMLLVKFSNHVSLKDKDPDERKAVVCFPFRHFMSGNTWNGEMMAFIPLTVKTLLG